jgi:serine/threonine protein kinase
MARYSRIKVATEVSTQFSREPSTYYPPKPEVGLSIRRNSISCCSTKAASHGEEKYNWIDGVESLEKYKPGGYHPVMIGDMLHPRYHIVDKLGFGGYSTIWLARDTRQEQYVAVKVGIAGATLPRETKILRALSSSSSVHPGRKSIPVPLDEFQVHGTNGTHTCYTMAPARCNLRAVSFSRLFPIEAARALSGGIILAIAYTHSQGYVMEVSHCNSL